MLRFPGHARRLLFELQSGDISLSSSCRAANVAARLLSAHGFDRPSWQQLSEGVLPEAPTHDTSEPGEYKHGWQFEACSALEIFSREQHFLPSLPSSHQAIVRSASGPGASHWLIALPTHLEKELQPEIWQIAARRRLRLSILPSVSFCPANSCRRRLDDLGDHLANCSLCGNIQRRAKPHERTWQRVFREAGARVVNQPMLRDCGLGLPFTDSRRIDFVARGTPLFGGLPIYGDASLVSPVRGDGTAYARAATTDGIALQRTRATHENTYFDLVNNDRVAFVMLGSELGGRFSDEALRVLKQLAAAKARQAPDLLRSSIRHGWHHRWLCMLSVATQSTLAESLLKPGSQYFSEIDGACPDLLDLICDRSLVPPVVSRLR